MESGITHNIRIQVTRTLHIFLCKLVRCYFEEQMSRNYFIMPKVNTTAVKKIMYASIYDF